MTDQLSSTPTTSSETSIADVAVFNVVLAPLEIAALAGGQRPEQVMSPTPNYPVSIGNCGAASKEWSARRLGRLFGGPDHLWPRPHPLEPRAYLMRERLRLAWLVFRGKVDVVRWDT